MMMDSEEEEEQTALVCDNGEWHNLFFASENRLKRSKALSIANSPN